MKDEYDFSNAKRGPVVPMPSHQTEIQLWLDNEVLDWLRESVNEVGGGNYQDTINSALRAHMEAQEDAALIRARKVKAVAWSAGKKFLPCFKDRTKKDRTKVENNNA